MVLAGDVVPREREYVIEVPEISCPESVEVVKSIFQERSTECMCEQSEVINNLKTRPDLAAYSGAGSR